MDLVDTFPFDFTRSEAVTLHGSLSNAYATAGRARFLVERSGVDPRYVAWPQPAFEFWRDILHAASAARRLRSLLAEAIGDAATHAYHEQWRAFLRVTVDAQPSGAAWLPALAAALDEAAARRPDAYILFSARRVLERIEQFVDLRLVLSEVERETLTAAAYARAHLLLDPAACAAQLDRLTGLPAPAGAILEIARRAALDASLEGMSGPSTGFRADLLAALLRVGEALELHRDALAPAWVGKPPPEDAGLDEWLAFLTCEVRTVRAVATHVLETKTLEGARPLERFVVLRFEALRRRVGDVLMEAGVNVAVAAPRIVLARTFPSIPPAVVRRIRAEATRAARTLPKLPHLGETAPPIGIDLLVPLPRSAIAGPLRFHLDGRHFHVLSLCSADTGEDVLSTSGSGSELIVDPATLRAGTSYHWTLARDYGTGNPSPIAGGVLRTLSDEEQARWNLLDASAGADTRRSFQIAMGLWNDVLAELWPTVGEASTPLADLVLAYRILLDAYDRTDPGSSKHGDYWKAGEWAYMLISPDEGPRGDGEEQTIRQRGE